MDLLISFKLYLHTLLIVYEVLLLFRIAIELVNFSYRMINFSMYFWRAPLVPTAPPLIQLLLIRIDIKFTSLWLQVDQFLLILYQILDLNFRFGLLNLLIQNSFNRPLSLVLRIRLIAFLTIHSRDIWLCKLELYKLWINLLYCSLSFIIWAWLVTLYASAWIWFRI